MHDLVRAYAHEAADRDEPAAERDAALERAWTCLAATAQHAIVHVNPRTWAAEAQLLHLRGRAAMLRTRLDEAATALTESLT